MGAGCRPAIRRAGAIARHHALALRHPASGPDIDRPGGLGL